MSETFSSIQVYHKDYLFYRQYRRIVIKILLISNIYIFFTKFHFTKKVYNKYCFFKCQ